MGYIEYLVLAKACNKLHIAPANEIVFTTSKLFVYAKKKKIETNT